MFLVEGAVIACAGLGSRLGLGLPKCMIDVAGTTVLSRVIRLLQPLVPRIHVVVGYREEMVIEHCALHHRDVVIVRNTEFRSTNTAQSLALGSVGFKRKVLYLDGDLIMEANSLTNFVQAAAETEILVGVTKSKSSQAVYARLVTATSAENSTRHVIEAFSRHRPEPMEWANVFCAPPSILEDASGFVFERLQQCLPAPAHTLDLHEIDTPEDLARAQAELTPSCHG